jgi:hypothetical protein
MFPNISKEDLALMGIPEEEIPVIISYTRIRMVAMLGCGIALGMTICLWFISVVIIFG